MNLRRFILSLGLGLLAVHALPQRLQGDLQVTDHGGTSLPDVNEYPKANGSISSLEARTLPPAQPLTKIIDTDSGSLEGLYVPFLYAGYISASGTTWKRYQCDARTKKDKYTVVSEKNGPTSLPAMMLTDGLATCVSVTVVSRQGAMMAHVPPYVCQILSGEKGADPDPKTKRQAEIIKDAAKKLRNEYLDKMGVAASREKLKARAVQVTKNLFDLPLNYWERIPTDRKVGLKATDRSTTIDLTKSPPVYFIEDVPLDFSLP
ncbi:hypothetical protein N7492_009274 [Penicillium capsulatum]|uniref:Uncharacterized protein n=1 Tax=Penicillium capsulatum TaxID=69766 RepID=A0A9W9HV05_9EURO|nr:hypothetical protein N7492_009274 [Penicillium capsulatum]